MRALPVLRTLVAAAVVPLTLTSAPGAHAASPVLVTCGESALVDAVNTANAAGGGSLILAPLCTYTLTSAHSPGEPDKHRGCRTSPPRSPWPAWARRSSGRQAHRPSGSSRSTGRPTSRAPTASCPSPRYRSAVVTPASVWEGDRQPRRQCRPHRQHGPRQQGVLRGRHLHRWRTDAHRQHRHREHRRCQRRRHLHQRRHGDLDRRSGGRQQPEQLRCPAARCPRLLTTARPGVAVTKNRAARLRAPTAERAAAHPRPGRAPSAGRDRFHGKRRRAPWLRQGPAPTPPRALRRGHLRHPSVPAMRRVSRTSWTPVSRW